MKLCIRFLSIAGLFASAVFAREISTPVFIFKDGDATVAGYSGTKQDIYVDGGPRQSVGWITFQTQGIDVSNIASAKLLLFVKSLAGPGTLQARRLTADISAPENNVPFASIPIDTAIAATRALGTFDVEKVLQIDLTAMVKGVNFKGVALTSDDGLAVSFDSKEGHLAPMLLLTNVLGNASAKWYSGSGVPGAGLGVDGDYYLNTSNGDVYSKASGAWAGVTNIAGPQGQKGDRGLQGPIGLTGPQGLKGDQGLFGAAGPTGPQGVKGDQGLQGSAGAQGLKGDKGDPGLQGPTGLTGPQGQKGDQGPPGAIGPIGLPGATGSFPEGAASGDMHYWNGAAWVMMPVGQPGQFLQVSASTLPSWSGAAFPAVTTAAVSSIGQTVATGGGNVTSNGGAVSTTCGVCWNISGNPTIADNKTTNGTGTGAFTSSITGLTSRTTYHVRAYAVNSAGTVYGIQVSFTTN